MLKMLNAMLLNKVSCCALLLLYMDAVSIFLPVTFAILGEKTTVMSPEVFVTAGVPCCRYYYIDFYY